LLKRNNVLKMPPERWITQSSLRRLLAMHETLTSHAENLKKMSETYVEAREDLERAIKLGSPVEPGPVWEESRQRRILRERKARRAG
jgi:hypothetical protein